MEILNTGIETLFTNKKKKSKTIKKDIFFIIFEKNFQNYKHLTYKSSKGELQTLEKNSFLENKTSVKNQNQIKNTLYKMEKIKKTNILKEEINNQPYTENHFDILKEIHNTKKSVKHLSSEYKKVQIEQEPKLQQKKITIFPFNNKNIISHFLKNKDFNNSHSYTHKQKIFNQNTNDILNKNMKGLTLEKIPEKLLKIKYPYKTINQNKQNLVNSFLHLAQIHVPSEINSKSTISSLYLNKESFVSSWNNLHSTSVNFAQNNKFTNKKNRNFTNNFSQKLSAKEIKANLKNKNFKNIEINKSYKKITFVVKSLNLKKEDSKITPSYNFNKKNLLSSKHIHTNNLNRITDKLFKLNFNTLAKNSIYVQFTSKHPYENIKNLDVNYQVITSNKKSKNNKKLNIFNIKVENNRNIYKKHKENSLPNENNIKSVTKGKSLKQESKELKNRVYQKIMYQSINNKNKNIETTNSNFNYEVIQIKQKREHISKNTQYIKTPKNKIKVKNNQQTGTLKNESKLRNYEKIIKKHNLDLQSQSLLKNEHEQQKIELTQKQIYSNINGYLINLGKINKKNFSKQIVSSKLSLQNSKQAFKNTQSIKLKKSELKKDNYEIQSKETNFVNIFKENNKDIESTENRKKIKIEDKSKNLNLDSKTNTQFIENNIENDNQNSDFHFDTEQIEYSEQNHKNEFLEEQFEKIFNKNNYNLNIKMNNVSINLSLRNQLLNMVINLNNNLLSGHPELNNEIKSILNETGFKNFNIVIKDKTKKTTINSNKVYTTHGTRVKERAIDVKV